ncbi:MFS transporter [Ilumatobacter sp.]|uniref:MFS transporter n=1 Tax=Ilumatobacter sp. TaxID=1967498 RepID=UPI003C5D965D
MSTNVHQLDESGVEPSSSVTTDPKAQRNILIAMCTALIAVIASVSGLNVAQQDLAIDLGASQNAVLWIINAYTIALAALLLPIGAVGDRWGRKPVLLAGLAVFGLASLGAALAPTVGLMIAARVAAGVGAAMIMPVTLSVITSSFPPADRARAIGIWAGFAGSGGILGLFFSSFMVDIVDWRWLFILPISLVIVSAVATVAFVPNSHEQSTHRFDIGGSVLSALAIGGIVLGIHEGPERGWTDPIALAGVIVGVVALVAFVLWENRQADPLLDMSAFRDRGLSSGSSTLVIVFAVMFGIFLVLFPYLQAVVGWSALRSAAGLLPMALVMMPTSTFAPRIAARVGARRTMIAGVTIFGGGMMTLALRASVEGGYLSVLPGLMLIGLGMGLTMTPATEAITATLPAEKQGVASALNDTSREVGGALGVALLGSILSSGYRSAIEPSLEGLPPEIAETASEGIGSAYAVAESAGADAPRIIDAAQHAFVDGWVTSMWVGVALSAVALAVLIVRGPGTGSSEPTSEAPDAAVPHGVSTGV